MGISTITAPLLNQLLTDPGTRGGTSSGPGSSQSGRANDREGAREKQTQADLV